MRGVEWKFVFFGERTIVIMVQIQFSLDDIESNGDWLCACPCIEVTSIHRFPHDVHCICFFFLFLFFDATRCAMQSMNAIDFFDIIITKNKNDFTELIIYDILQSADNIKMYRSLYTRTRTRQSNKQRIYKTRKSEMQINFGSRLYRCVVVHGSFVKYKPLCSIITVPLHNQ